MNRVARSKATSPFPRLAPFRWPPPARPGRAKPHAPAGSAQRAAALSPPCRLRLEGGEGQEAWCEILELSAEGVAIAIPGGKPVRQGQHGRLLIGPPEGDHYELPVDVGWVEPAMSRLVLALTFPTRECWTYSRG